MSVITAYKCDHTGKLFEDKAKYQKHIRKVAAQRRRIKQIEKNIQLEAEWWADNFWNKVRSLEQLQAAILHHRDVFAANGLAECWPRYKRLKATPIIEFTQFSLRWSDRVSNSHSCPHNGVTNWGGRDKTAPLNYPGWSGRFDYVVQSYKSQEGFYPGSSDMWKKSRIHTGTGGGGGFNQKTFRQSFGFGIELFAADWPAMAEAYEKAKAWCVMTNSTRPLDVVVNELHPASELVYD